MEKNSRIYVAGHGGLIGSAFVQRLEADSFVNVLVRDSSELDLRDERAVGAFFKDEMPEYVFLCAGVVGGIGANEACPVDFIYPNLMIECNVMQAAWKAGVKKLLFLGCACAYPRDCEQPIREEYLLSGPLEPTNVAHAIAKISGIVMCQSYNQQHGTSFLSCIPANVFGPRDNFDLETGHVVASLIARLHEATEKHQESVALWGTGKPRRDFIYVDDVADACLYLLDNYEASAPINVSAGSDVSIAELAGMVAEVVGYRGRLEFDVNKPSGMPKKLLDNRSLRSLGWTSSVSLRDGLAKTYEWYLMNQQEKGE